MSDAAESSVTIKSGKGYEAMWFVTKGSPDQIKSWLIRFFDLPYDAVAELTPYEVTALAEDIAQGRSNVATILGGTIATPTANTPAPTADGDPWAQIAGEASEAPQKAEDPLAGLRDQIANAESPAALQRLWAQNQDAFRNEDLLAEWKAKGKSLAA